MALMTADHNIVAIGPNTVVPMSCNAADIFYQGAIVFTDAGGGVQATYAATLDKVAGISLTRQTTTAAAQIIEVCIRGCFWMPVPTATFTAADEGDILVVDASATSSDNIADALSFTDITQAQHDMVLGQILRVTATQVLVFIQPGFTGRSVAATTTNAFM